MLGKKHYLPRINHVNDVSHVLFLSDGLAMGASYDVLGIKPEELSDRSGSGGMYAGRRRRNQNRIVWK